MNVKGKDVERASSMRRPACEDVVNCMHLLEEDGKCHTGITS